MCLLWVAFSCDALEVSEIPDYPLKVEPLALLELDELNKKYQEENENLCSTLNEYGFSGYSRVLFVDDVNPCSLKETIRVELSEPDTLVTHAIQAVLTNSFYTNVSDSNALQIQEILPLYGCTICEGPAINSVPLEWKITFAPQQIDGVDVFNSEISVFVDALGVNRIWGNWIPDFYAPGLLDVGYLRAEEKVVGSVVNLSSITGQDSTLIVAEELITEPTVFQVVPIINEFGELEFRKTWKITINYTYEEIENIFAHVDVVDGTLLQFVTSEDEEEN